MITELSMVPSKEEYLIVLHVCFESRQHLIIKVQERTHKHTHTHSNSCYNSRKLYQLLLLTTRLSLYNTSVRGFVIECEGGECLWNSTNGRCRVRPMKPQTNTLQTDVDTLRTVTVVLHKHSTESHVLTTFFKLFKFSHFITSRGSLVSSTATNTEIRPLFSGYSVSSY